MTKKLTQISQRLRIVYNGGAEKSALKSSTSKKRSKTMGKAEKKAVGPGQQSRRSTTVNVKSSTGASQHSLENRDKRMTEGALGSRGSDKT